MNTTQVIIDTAGGLINPVIPYINQADNPSVAQALLYMKQMPFPFHYFMTLYITMADSIAQSQHQPISHLIDKGGYQNGGVALIGQGVKMHQPIEIIEKVMKSLEYQQMIQSIINIQDIFNETGQQNGDRSFEDYSTEINNSKNKELRKKLLEQHWESKGQYEKINKIANLKEKKKEEEKRKKKNVDNIVDIAIDNYDNNRVVSK